jgi:phosphoenolpyruvate phosphomutase
MGAESRALRAHLVDRSVTMAASAHSTLSARLVEQAGFPVVWASGLELSTAKGVPDANILTMSDVLESARELASAVDIPVLADCDSGYGDVGNVAAMLRSFEAARVAGVCIEDKAFPKLNSLAVGTQDLVPVEEMVARLIAAADAKRDSDFVVVARLEALIAGRPMEDALFRAHAYEAAGADALLIHSKRKSADEIAEFCANYDGTLPLIAVPTTYSSVSARELGEMGISLVIYANQTIRSAVVAMRKTLMSIAAAGMTAHLEEELAPVGEIFALQKMPEFLAAKAAVTERAAELVAKLGEMEPPKQRSGD